MMVWQDWWHVLLPFLWIRLSYLKQRNPCRMDHFMSGVNLNSSTMNPPAWELLITWFTFNNSRIAVQLKLFETFCVLDFCVFRSISSITQIFFDTGFSFKYNGNVWTEFSLTSWLSQYCGAWKYTVLVSNVKCPMGWGISVTKILIWGSLSLSPQWKPAQPPSLSNWICATRGTCWAGLLRRQCMTLCVGYHFEFYLYSTRNCS